MARRIVGSTDADHGAGDRAANDGRIGRTASGTPSRRAAGQTGDAGARARSKDVMASSGTGRGGRQIRSAGSADGVRQGRSARTARSASSSATASREPSSGARSGFVDARRLPDEDIVARTLAETTGALGVSTRPKVVDFNARLREKRKTGVRIIALRVLAGLAALAALTALVWFLFFSSFFRLETGSITVSGGNEWVSEQDIVAIADKQTGKSLLLVSSQEVVKQLTGIPGVTEATVSKEFPDGLSVHVEAQQPAAMLKGSSGMLVAVDSKARVLNQVGDASTDGIPVIEVKDVDASLDSRAVKEALKILGGLPDDLRAMITAVRADTQDSITTELESGAHVVVWGDSSDLKLKQAIVGKILADPNVIGDKTQIDVSAPKRPIIK